MWFHSIVHQEVTTAPFHRHIGILKYFTNFKAASGKVSKAVNQNYSSISQNICEI